MMNAKEKMMKSAIASEGYFFDHETEILYMSTVWEKKSNTLGTEACLIRDKIESMFPSVRTEVIARHRKNTAITYDMMRAYISIMPDAEKNMAELNRQIAMSKVFKSSYKYVAEWFFKKFPHYGELVVKDSEGNISWNAAEEYKQAMNDAKTNTAAAPEESEESDSDAIENVG